MFRFFESGWLYALATVPLLALLFWASARSRRKAMDTFGDSDLVQKLEIACRVLVNAQPIVLKRANQRANRLFSKLS